VPRKKKAVEAVKRLQKRTERKAAMKLKILAYLADPGRDWPTRDEIAKVVLGYTHNTGLYRHFDPGELAEIEAEGLRLRRTRYTGEMARIDQAVIRQACTGETQAARLAYQRLEGWEPGERVNIQGGQVIEIVTRFEVSLQPGQLPDGQAQPRPVTEAVTVLRPALMEPAPAEPTGHE